MLKNLKLSSKMTVIGVMAIVAMTILYGVVFLSNRMVSKNVAMEQLRLQQRDTIGHMRRAQKDLLLAAMDSIIDKADGEISAERMGIINTSAAYLIDSIPTVHEAADTGEEKQLAQDMETGIKAMVKGIQEHLFSVFRDIVYAGDLLENGGRGQESSGSGVTETVFRILRNAGVLNSRARPNLAVCWGGHAIGRMEYDYTKQTGTFYIQDVYAGPGLAGIPRGR